MAMAAGQPASRPPASEIDNKDSILTKKMACFLLSQPDVFRSIVFVRESTLNKYKSKFPVF
jgi:hypothetical protein